MPLVVLLVFFLAPAQPVVICFFLFLVSDKSSEKKLMPRCQFCQHDFRPWFSPILSPGDVRRI